MSELIFFRGNTKISYKRIIVFRHLFNDLNMKAYAIKYCKWIQLYELETSLQHALLKKQSEYYLP